MIYNITLIVFGIAILGIIESFLFYYVKEKFDFKFPIRDIDNRISIKKLRLYIKKNEVSSESLLNLLKFIIILDFIINLSILLLLGFILIIFVFK